MIRSIQERTDTKVKVEDDGTVQVAANDQEKADAAIAIIRELTQEAEIGKLYLGVVKRTVDFGAFVEIFPGTEGLVHISHLAEGRVERTTDVVREGDELLVRVIDIDRSGKIRLSRKEGPLGRHRGRAALSGRWLAPLRELSRRRPAPRIFDGRRLRARRRDRPAPRTRGQRRHGTVQLVTAFRPSRMRRPRLVSPLSDVEDRVVERLRTSTALRWGALLAVVQLPPPSRLSPYCEHRRRRGGRSPPPWTLAVGRRAARSSRGPRASAGTETLPYDHLEARDGPIAAHVFPADTLPGGAR